MKRISLHIISLLLSFGLVFNTSATVLHVLDLNLEEVLDSKSGEDKIESKVDLLIRRNQRVVYPYFPKSTSERINPDKLLSIEAFTSSGCTRLPSRKHVLHESFLL